MFPDNYFEIQISLEKLHKINFMTKISKCRRSEISSQPKGKYVLSATEEVMQKRCPCPFKNGLVDGCIMDGCIYSTVMGRKSESLLLAHSQNDIRDGLAV